MASGRKWMLVETVSDDGETHAAPVDGRHAFCSRPVQFPAGGSAEPTCGPCHAFVRVLGGIQDTVQEDNARRRATPVHCQKCGRRMTLADNGTYVCPTDGPGRTQEQP